MDAPILKRQAKLFFLNADGYVVSLYRNVLYSKSVSKQRTCYVYVHILSASLGVGIILFFILFIGKLSNDGTLFNYLPNLYIMLSIPLFALIDFRSWKKRLFMLVHFWLATP